MIATRRPNWLEKEFTEARDRSILIELVRKLNPGEVVITNAYILNLLGSRPKPKAHKAVLELENDPR